MISKLGIAFALYSIVIQLFYIANAKSILDGRSIVGIAIDIGIVVIYLLLIRSDKKLFKD